mmetsp:Transcript_33972/g.70653  ORF Transcript_33972/g.70653 Transcript_33972/m.70653 type:complete len:107 (+) Transcript_33972:1692-2012(+)
MMLPESFSSFVATALHAPVPMQASSQDWPADPRTQFIIGTVGLLVGLVVADVVGEVVRPLVRDVEREIVGLEVGDLVGLVVGEEVSLHQLGYRAICISHAAAAKSF